MQKALLYLCCPPLTVSVSVHVTVNSDLGTDPRTSTSAVRRESR